MIKLRGKYNTAKVFTNNIDDITVGQVINLLNQPFIAGSKIRIMPDTHAGKGCTIGTTMTIKDKVVPNLVGVDIGCGVLCCGIGKIDIDYNKLDEFIRKNIPHGFRVNTNSYEFIDKRISKIRCMKELGKTPEEFGKALGSLGGGNHFIEINEDEDGCKYVVIHSGSRNLGKRVAEYYQNKAIEHCNEIFDKSCKHGEELIIKQLKSNGKEKEIQKAIEIFKNNTANYKPQKELCYLEGQLMEDYLHDMNLVQEFASRNRECIATKIIEDFLNIDLLNVSIIETIHNYIDMTHPDNIVLRKGAVSAKEGEFLIIPINMRDGSLICVGKGNEDWNKSAPHGAGRILSRGQAKKTVDMEDYKKSMEGIFTTCVNQSTLDESPQVYKPMKEIIENIKETANIVYQIKPVYNFKSN